MDLILDPRKCIDYAIWKRFHEMSVVVQFKSAFTKLRIDSRTIIHMTV